MDRSETGQKKTGESRIEGQKSVSAIAAGINTPLTLDNIKSFLRLTGGSPLYCLSAVFIAYGIVKVLGPILAASESLRGALPCILTLHVYELALLAVLIVIVSRKVVDDAISVGVLIAVFMVGTSMALGSVGDRGSFLGLATSLAGLT